MDAKPLVLCVMGPTASGKTDLALKLAASLPVSIVSVDSAMVYRGMDIGTAKPSKETLATIPHRLIDICEPQEIYSAGRFQADAAAEIKQILAAGRIPLLVGGTMLYFHALQQGIAALPTAKPELRARLLQEAEQDGWASLHERLNQLDPIAAQRIHPNDPQRIQRALEVYYSTGKSLTEWWQTQTATQLLPYHYFSIALTPGSRTLLHDRIAQRFHAMLKQGLIQEVEYLLHTGKLTPQLPASRAVGYRQVCDYLVGKLAREQLAEKGIIATRQLAKRQLTWLRSWPEVHWFDSDDPNLLCKILALLPSL